MKIIIDKSKGPVVFLGSMNSMPMMYALELKKLGVDVLYFVDVPEKDTLSRPENHFKSITYPYPDWIIEFSLKSQVLVVLFPEYYSKKIKNYVLKKTGVEAQCYVTNGFFTSLVPRLTCQNTATAALAFGSDFHTWADCEASHELAIDFRRKSIFRYMPKILSGKIIKAIVKKQYLGFSKSNKVIYFPKGFHKRGDEVIERLKNANVNIAARYDVSAIPLEGRSTLYKEQGEKLVFFSGVRFMFETSDEGDGSINKGNDIIIEGLKQYYLTNPNIEIHFVEKGPDVDRAKQICENSGLDKVIIWHKEMKFNELLSLYEISDICFDQCGKHWIGAIGGYALYLGKPLIANDEITHLSDVWPKKNPVCSAKTSDEVFEQIKKLEDISYRKKISQDSVVFAKEYFSPEAFMNNHFEVSN